MRCRLLNITNSGDFALLNLFFLVPAACIANILFDLLYTGFGFNTFAHSSLFFAWAFFMSFVFVVKNIPIGSIMETLVEICNSLATIIFTVNFVSDLFLPFSYLKCLKLVVDVEILLFLLPFFYIQTSKQYDSFTYKIRSREYNARIKKEEQEKKDSDKKVINDHYNAIIGQVEKDKDEALKNIK